MEEKVKNKLRIREAIQKRRMTITEVAEKLGKAKQTLNTILTNGNPSFETLCRIAEVLDVPISELYSEGDNEELTALVRHKGAYHYATTLEELAGIVERIKAETKAKQ